MRHLNRGRKLGRTTAHREAMLRNLSCNLIEHGRVMTTMQKAKEARFVVERCISYAKKGVAALAAVEAQVPALRAEVEALKAKLVAAGTDKEKLDLRSKIDRAGKKIAALRAKGEHYRRLAMSRLHQKGAVQKLFDVIAPRYADRAGGYTRILKASYRLGDKATVGLFELV